MTPARVLVPIAGWTALVAAGACAGPSGTPSGPSGPSAPPVLSGRGTAIVDGAIGSDWSGAGSTAISVALPGGARSTATLLVMNNGAELFLALRIPMSPACAPSGGAVFHFDANRSGAFDFGDDYVSHYDRSSSTPGSADLVQLSGGGAEDVSVGGTEDIVADAVWNGSALVFEVAHPLSSGDERDISVKPGDTLGLLSVLTNLTVCGQREQATVGASPALFDIRIQ
jgi:hypothetical protein